MIDRLKYEMARGRYLYPDETVWHKLTIPQMFRAILAELWEAAIAAWRHDWHGKHGFVVEMTQAAGICLRAAAEIERRRKNEPKTKTDNRVAGRV